MSRPPSGNLLRALFLGAALTACSSSSSGVPEKASSDSPTTSATSSRAPSSTIVAAPQALRRGPAVDLVGASPDDLRDARPRAPAAHRAAL